MTGDTYAMGFPAVWDHETVELSLHIENTAAIYAGHLAPMYRAAQRHYDRGAGDRARLVRGLERVAAVGARDYAREHGTPGDRWYDLFSVACRRAVAEHLADYFVAEYNAGNRW